MYLLLSGDITETAHADEFNDAYEQIEELRREICGKVLCRDIAPLGRAGRRLKCQAIEDNRLREMLEKVRKQLGE